MNSVRDVVFVLLAMTGLLIAYAITISYALGRILGSLREIARNTADIRAQFPPTERRRP